MDDKPNSQSLPIFLNQIENLNPPYPPSFGPPNINRNINLSPKPEQKAKLNNDLPQISAHSQPPILTQHQPSHIISKILTNILNPQPPQITQVKPSNLIPHLKRKVSQKKIELLSRRVKIADHAPEAAFFDPTKATFIPKSLR